MSGKARFSFKRLQIDKATTTMMIFIVAGLSITIFSVVATRALLSQRSYLARVINKKEEAKKQIAVNLKARDALVESYRQFVTTPQNIIGGNPSGQGENDGDNARIILDALPSKYDFPALTTSLEKLLTSKGLNLKIESIGGTDDEVAQSQTTDTGTEPIELPVELAATGSYGSVQGLIGLFERSIRPIRLKTMSLSGNEDNLKLEVTGGTYYQPEKRMNIKMEEVR